MIKTLYFDLETTGLDPEKNGIIQFAAIVDHDDVEVDRVNIKMQPFEEAEVEDAALAKTGLTLDDILEYQSQEDGFREVLAFFDKHINKFDKNDKFWVAGYNVRFDIDFLQAFFKRHGEKYGIGSYMSWKYIDAMPMMHIMSWRGKVNIKDHKLDTVCEAFNIPLENAHDAMGDIEATRALIKKLFSK